MPRKKIDMKFIAKRGNSYSVLLKWQAEGKPCQRSIGSYNAKKYGSDKLALEAALKARDQAVADLQLERIQARVFTVQKLFDESMERCASVKTAKRHTQIYNALVPQTLKETAIEKVTLKDIQATVDAFAETHSQDAVRRAPMIWRAIYKQAAINELYVPDRSQAIQVPKSKIPVKRRQKFVSAEDLETFYDTLMGYNPDGKHSAELNATIYSMMRTMQYCGLRPQEGMALMRDDVDLEHGILHVRRSVGSTKTATRQIIPLKTEESRRDLPIPDALRPILEERCASVGEGLLFADLDGKPFEIDWLSNYVHLVSKKAKVSVTLYMHRHNFATDLIRVVNPKTVQGMMGHKSAVMTLRYADSPKMEEMTAAMEKRKLN